MRRLVTLLLVTVAGCSKPVSKQECAQLLDHYVEHLAVQNSFGDKPQAPAQLKREAAQLARRDRNFAECPDRVSRTQLECALKAPSADRVEQCLLW